MKKILLAYNGKPFTKFPDLWHIEAAANTIQCWGSGSDIQSPMLQAHPCSSILAKYFKIILK